MLIRKRVNAKTLEVLLLLLMAIFAVVIIVLFITAVKLNNPDPLVAITEIQLLTLVILLGLTFTCVKIWEQNKMMMAILAPHIKASAQKKAVKKAKRRMRK